VAYFLLEAQPDIKRGYSPSLRTISKKIIENRDSINEPLKGAVFHTISISIRAAAGEKINTKLEARGKAPSLIKSLTASAIGCKSPNKETLLGPLRLWAKPRIFRSSKVKKATLIKIGTTINKTSKIFILFLLYLFKVTLKKL